MAPAKRTRPAFSPPRPGRPTSAAVPAGNAGKRQKTNGKSLGDVTKKGTKAVATETRRRSRLVSPTPSASDSQDDGEEEDDEDEEDEADDNNEEERGRGTDEEGSPSQRPADDNASPEPDYILAEVTNESSLSANDPIIPLPLVHRILQYHFNDPDTTKISADAREMTGKYIDVFVREAIMRCAYEKSSGDSGAAATSSSIGGNGPAGARANRAGDGWLEVEDLEKVAVQLCLDF